LTVGAAKLKRHISVLDKVSHGQVLVEMRPRRPITRHARLLPVRYNRPRRYRTAKQRDELAPVHLHPSVQLVGDAVVQVSDGTESL